MQVAHEVSTALGRDPAEPGTSRLAADLGPVVYTAKHTPGPWHVVKHHDGRVAICHGPGSGFWVATISPYWPERVQANARLIAAAPDLLAALQGFGRWLELQPENYQTHFADLLTAARAAIAKATK